MSLKSTYSQEKLKEKGQWFTLMESQSLAADLRSGVQDAPNARGLILEIITSSGADTPNYNPELETVDEDGNSITLWNPAASISTDTTTTYVFYPGWTVGDFDAITEGADVPLPRTWRLFFDKTTGSFTVEVHACYL